MSRFSHFPILVIVTACALLFSALADFGEARTQMNLAARAQLRPVNWPTAQKLWFAPGPYWIDEWDKGVQSGTMDQVASLKIWNSTRATEFGKGFIRFERTGGVKEGTLSKDTSLCVVNTASPSKLTLSFQGGRRVEFGYDGCVMKGTLAQAASLRTYDGKTNSYPKGTIVDFNGNGLVTRAVLPPGAGKPVDGIYQGTCSITGIGVFPLTYAARRGVFEGLAEAKHYHLRFKGNYDAKGSIRNGILTGWVEDWNPQQKKFVRWTVRGPVTGTISAAGARGSVSATTADGAITRTGTWSANRTGA